MAAPPRRGGGRGGQCRPARSALWEPVPPWDGVAAAARRLPAAGRGRSQDIVCRAAVGGAAVVVGGSAGMPPTAALRHTGPCPTRWRGGLEKAQWREDFDDLGARSVREFFSRPLARLLTGGSGLPPHLRLPRRPGPMAVRRCGARPGPAAMVQKAASTARASPCPVSTPTRSTAIPRSRPETGEIGGEIGGEHGGGRGLGGEGRPRGRLGCLGADRCRPAVGGEHREPQAGRSHGGYQQLNEFPESGGSTHSDGLQASRQPCEGHGSGGYGP